MAETLLDIEKQISMISLSEQIRLMVFLANAINNQNISAMPAKKKRYFGCAKGELNYPNDIDFCNDEIAEMFGVRE